MAGRKCEHCGGNETCRAGAVFRVSRGRKHDAQDSCRRHLAATVDALQGGERRPVTVTVIYAEADAPDPVATDADSTWVHGTRLGREHRSVAAHLVEDHAIDSAWVDSASDAAVHGKHDGLHKRTWAYAADLPHPLTRKDGPDGR